MSASSTFFAAFVADYGNAIMWIAGSVLALGILFAILEMIHGVRNLYKKYR